MAAACKPTDLKYLLECSICLNSFQDPRVLPCLHSYCLGCLESHVASNKGSDGSFLCPQCREKVALPEEGTSGFPKNFFVNSMKDVLPASLIQGSRSAAGDFQSQLMCQHHGDDSGYEHGVAVIFCKECDAHFCKTCAKHHRMFGITKDHEVSALCDKITEADTKTNKKCALHEHAINWYCESCGVPACADCILENHQSHDLKKLSAVETAFKVDMAEVSVTAAKHLESLREQLEYLQSNKVKMGEELNKTKTDISKTSDTLCKMIKDREQILQGKVESFREVATKQFDEATERLQTAITNTSSLVSSSEALCQATSDEMLETVIQAPTLKQKLLHQQNLHVPFVELTTNSSPLRCRHENLTTAGFLGSVSMETSTVCSSTQEVREQSVFLNPPLNTIKLDCSDMYVAGIAPIDEDVVCVAHFNNSSIWVYQKDGALIEKVELTCVEKVSGMVAIDYKQRKMAIVDRSQSKVHFIQLTETFQVVHSVITDISFPCTRISISRDKVILVSNESGDDVLLLKRDGKVLSKMQLSLPPGKTSLKTVIQTNRGYVVCDKESKAVLFVDDEFEVVKSIIDEPRRALVTSSEHVLVADRKNSEIKVFDDRGTLLGNIQDKQNILLNVHFIHVEEAEKALYVACSTTSTKELRLYSLKQSRLPPKPIVQDVSKLSVNIRMVDV